jgi:NAD(P)-dependent dehydrogenase (short-subunit alcohol dehydrogenase family)
MIATNETGSFAGKVAFVTGAGSGMGRRTALAFAREGASVVLADVSDHCNQDTARMIEELGGRALAVRCDVTQSEQVQATVAVSPSGTSTAVQPRSRIGENRSSSVEVGPGR